MSTNDDEINLIDYIKVVIKRKWLILGITLGAALVAGIFSFVMPKTYKLDTILEVGRMEEFIPEAPNQLIEKIKNGNYDETIKTKLNIEKLPKIEVSNPTDTRLVIISINSSNPEEAKKILEELENLILEEHQDKFDLQKNILLDDKKRNENKISSLENEKEILEEKVNYLTNLMATDPSPTNQFLLTEAKESLEKKSSEIADQYLELNSVERKLNAYETTRIVKAPIVPKNPSGSNLVLNVVIAIVLGLFIGILVAFIKEWWENAKKELKD